MGQEQERNHPKRRNPTGRMIAEGAAGLRVATVAQIGLGRTERAAGVRAAAPVSGIGQTLLHKVEQAGDDEKSNIG